MDVSTEFGTTNKFNASQSLNLKLQKVTLHKRQEQAASTRAHSVPHTVQMKLRTNLG